ncbi:M28 family peptidase [Alteribacter populi]|uniref:M28 family peptidase n=1 Tax=Alteribacter populi TaxID=2011011 RepID=UPI000BBA6FB3|nr:M28 family peptidase [Alteribacter populi]
MIKKHMMVVAVFALMFSMIPMSTFAAPPNDKAGQAFDNRIIKQIDVDNVYDHVYHLSENIGPRVAGTDAELETVDYLVEEFESYGYDNVEIQPFDQLGFTSYNVIATKTPNNANQDSGQMLIVGAHHDSVPGSPGANDDASGTGALLELARVMSNAPVDSEIRFIAFGAEERGLVGSRHYASTMTEDEVERTVGMFQLDMIGSADAGDLTMFTVDGEQNTVTDLAASAGARVSQNDIPPFSMLGRSDHVPFYERGIPAALFIHTPLEPWYHTPDDTIENIDIDKLEDVTKIVGAAVYHAARPDTPALERSQVAPQPVDYYYEDPQL